MEVWLSIAYYAKHMLEIRRIEQFVSGDAVTAEAAFRVISVHVQRFLWRYLADRLPNEQDRQDAIQAILERLWTGRAKIEARGIGPWWAYVARSARWYVYDIAGKPEEIELEQDIPAEDLRLIDRIAEISNDRTLLYRAADELWLGVEPAIDDSERKRRLLAAQFHYLHGRPWEEIAEIVGLGRPIPRDKFDIWLSNWTVLNELSYASLHRPNEELVATILRPERPLTSVELAEWSAGADVKKVDPPEGWTWDEVKVAILKYRNGLSETKISQMTGLSKQFVEDAVEKCRSRIPLPGIAKKLVRSFQSRHAPTDPLKSPGIWKRLVFQYHVSNELPQRQISEFLGPVACVAGYSLTAGMLNVWLSNGRLFAQLAAYVRKEGQDK